MLIDKVVPGGRSKGYLPTLGANGEIELEPADGPVLAQAHPAQLRPALFSREGSAIGETYCPTDPGQVHWRVRLTRARILFDADAVITVGGRVKRSGPGRMAGQLRLQWLAMVGFELEEPAAAGWTVTLLVERDDGVREAYRLIFAGHEEQAEFAAALGQAVVAFWQAPRPRALEPVIVNRAQALLAVVPEDGYQDYPIADIGLPVCPYPGGADLTPLPADHGAASWQAAGEPAAAKEPAETGAAGTARVEAAAHAGSGAGGIPSGASSSVRPEDTMPAGTVRGGQAAGPDADAFHAAASAPASIAGQRRREPVPATTRVAVIAGAVGLIALALSGIIAGIALAG